MKLRPRALIADRNPAFALGCNKAHVEVPPSVTFKSEKSTNASGMTQFISSMICRSSARTTWSEQPVTSWTFIP